MLLESLRPFAGGYVSLQILPFPIRKGEFLGSKDFILYAKQASWFDTLPLLGPGDLSRVPNTSLGTYGVRRWFRKKGSFDLADLFLALAKRKELIRTKAVPITSNGRE